MGIDSHNMESFVAKTKDKEVDCQIANNKKEVGNFSSGPRDQGSIPTRYGQKTGSDFARNHPRQMSRSTKRHDNEYYYNKH